MCLILPGQQTTYMVLNSLSTTSTNLGSTVGSSDLLNDMREERKDKQELKVIYISAVQGAKFKSYGSDREARFKDVAPSGEG